MTEKNISPEQMSPLALAFLGDCVYELCARRYVLSHGNCPNGILHDKTTAIVCAAYQSGAYSILEPILTEAEAAVMKRGRNSSTTHIPKNSGAQEYRRATGVESLFGYLSLKNNQQRIEELFEVIITEYEKNRQEG